MLQSPLLTSALGRTLARAESAVAKAGGGAILVGPAGRLPGALAATHARVHGVRNSVEGLRLAESMTLTPSPRVATLTGVLASLDSALLALQPATLPRGAGTVAVDTGAAYAGISAARTALRELLPPAPPAPSPFSLP